MTLIEPLIETRDFLIQNEPDIFHEEIQTQFNEKLNGVVIEEFCKRFTITPEDAIMMMEGIQLEEFFKC